MTWWFKDRPWSDEHAHPEFDGEMPPGPGAARGGEEAARIKARANELREGDRPPGWTRADLNHLAATLDPPAPRVDFSEFIEDGCGDPACTEEHGDECGTDDCPIHVPHSAKHATPLAPWGGPAPQPPHHARPERAMLARALLLGLVIGVLLAGCLGAFNWVDL